MQPTAEDTIITADGEMINFVALAITRNGIEPYVPKSSIQAQEILTLCDRNFSILDWLQTERISIGHYQHLIWHKIWFTSTCKKAILISAALQTENVPEFQHDLPNAINNRGPLDNLKKASPGHSQLVIKPI